MFSVVLHLLVCCSRDCPSLIVSTVAFSSLVFPFRGKVYVQYLNKKISFFSLSSSVRPFPLGSSELYPPLVVSAEACLLRVYQFLICAVEVCLSLVGLSHRGYVFCSLSSIGYSLPRLCSSLVFPTGACSSLMCHTGFCPLLVIVLPKS